MSEQEYLEDNIATVAFHLGQPGARISVHSDSGRVGLVVDPGEVLKEVSRRIESHKALLADVARIKVQRDNALLDMERFMKATGEAHGAIRSYLATFDRCGGSESVSAGEFAEGRQRMRDLVGGSKL